ncbi:MAG: exodeoxyribonuclease III, partial [Burkholderiales bacterium]|nr:exodeoxyribonuclease III [Burkholderiales bacterium]
MRFITANLNGVRSAASKGFFDWLDRQKADAVGVQELKAQADVVEAKFATCDKLSGHFHYAEKKGYSGVGLYTRETPSDVITGVGITEFDQEGRWVEKRFDKPGRKLSLISVYFPSGTS